MRFLELGVPVRLDQVFVVVVGAECADFTGKLRDAVGS